MRPTQHMLVTGALGNIGAPLVQQLQTAGSRFSVLRSKSPADAMNSLNRIVASGYAAGISPHTAQLLSRAPITAHTFANDHAAACKA